jgi:protein-serine/threonine kinase
MLAGYLPFDDDPANPEGDNINLLYKYIVNTPLTFPEYVTPHARDLLRRILVPNPRKRADLFEVARHSWLSEYAHIVEFITSSTTTPTEIQNTTVPAEEFADAPMIGRSASVRENAKAKANAPAAVGGLANKHGNIDPEAEAAYIRAQKDAKRRTVQVEYVAPTTQTQRGEPAANQPVGGSKTRVRSNSQGPVEVNDSPSSNRQKPLPRDPPVTKDVYSKNVSSRRPPSSHKQQMPTRPARDTRATSDNVYMTSASGGSNARPQTGGSMASAGSMRMAATRPSYGQPLPPAVAGTNAHGKIEQPISGHKDYNDIDADIQDRPPMGHPSISVPAKFAKVAGFPPTTPQSAHGPAAPEVKGHKRSNTIGDIGSKLLGRSGSLFGKNRKKSEQQPEKSRKYPPISMVNSMPGGDEPRPSMDSRASRRSVSLAFGKKRSGSMTGSNNSQEKQTRRFSLIPQSFSLKAIGIGKDYPTPPPEPQSQQDLPIQDPPELDSQGNYIEPTQQRGNGPFYDGMYEPGSPYRQEHPRSTPPQQQPQQSRYASGQYTKQPNAIPPYLQHGTMLNTGSDSSVDNMHRRPTQASYQSGGLPEPEAYNAQRIGNRGGRGVLQKPKRFTDAYDQDPYHGHEGSSGAAKRVMDFFRRRGKARGGEER